MDLKRPFIQQRMLFVAIVLLGFGLRVAFLDHQSLWWDEVKSVFRATISPSLLFEDLLNKKGHVPLYFLLLQGWAKLGVSDFLVRYFSVIWGTIGVALMYRLGDVVGKRPLAQTAAFLLAISPFHIWYSQEARMYSMLPSLLTAATLFLLYGIRKNQWHNWLAYALLMTTAVYTHYFTIFILFAHCLFFALHVRDLQQQAMRWFGTAVFITLSFSLYILRIVNNGGYQNATPGWIAPISWYDPILTLLTFSAGSTISPNAPISLILFFIFLMGFITILRHKTPRIISQLLKLWFFTPLLLIFIVSLGLRENFSLYMDRYLIIILPAYILLVAYGFVILKQRFAHRLFIPVLTAVIFILTLPSLYNLYFNDAFARTDMRQATATLFQKADTPIVVLGEGEAQLPFAYYAEMQQRDYHFIELPIDYSNADEAVQFNALMTTQIDQAATYSDNVWYLIQRFNRSPHGFLNGPQVDPQLAWLESNLTLVADWQFANIQLYQFKVE